MPTTSPSPAGVKPRAKATAKRASVRKVPAAKRPVARSTAPAKPATANYAERAVLIPVGAALIARDRVVESVSDTLSTYSSPTKTQAQLRRFERRGATARNRLEREVRKARVRVEREVRQRRHSIQSTVGDLDGRREAFAKSGGDLAGRVPELANRVQERILSLV